MNNMIGHNSVQIPHDGVLQGSSFGKKDKKRSTVFYRPTLMSEAMAKAGILPGTHMVAELAQSALVRQHNDNKNIRRSQFIAL